MEPADSPESVTSAWDTSPLPVRVGAVAVNEPVSESGMLNTMLMSTPARLLLYVPFTCTVTGRTSPGSELSMLSVTKNSATSAMGIDASMTSGTSGWSLSMVSGPIFMSSLVMDPSRETRYASSVRSLMSWSMDDTTVYFPVMSTDSPLGVT